MKALNFYKTDGFGEVDIVINTPSYEKLKGQRVFVKIKKLRLPVSGIDDLIKMKKKANRPIDQIDILELKNLKKHGRR